MKIRDLKPYPEYKDSGVAWLGEVPGHWDVSKVKNLARPGYKTFHSLPSSGLATSVPEARLCVTRARDAKQSFVTRGEVGVQRAALQGRETLWAAGAAETAFLRGAWEREKADGQRGGGGMMAGISPYPIYDDARGLWLAKVLGNCEEARPHRPMFGAPGLEVRDATGPS